MSNELVRFHFRGELAPLLPAKDRRSKNSSIEPKTIMSNAMADKDPLAPLAATKDLDPPPLPDLALQLPLHNWYQIMVIELKRLCHEDVCITCLDQAGTDELRVFRWRQRKRAR